MLVNLRWASSSWSSAAGRAASIVRILREYERGGGVPARPLLAREGAGAIVVIPVVQQMVRVDLRTRGASTCRRRT